MVDSSEMKGFFDKLSAAGSGGFEKSLYLFLEGIGLEFLRIIQDEIIRKKAMDTRLLLSSFHMLDNNVVWELSEGNLTITVGTNVEYAKYVNDGHWTCSKGEKMRFVPGHWKGDKFVYDPDAKTGMILKQKFVKGKHFWEDGIKILEKILPSLAEKMIDDFMKNYFG
ncbi:MAG: HK97 gp10 family phage protein [Clostridium sp.]|nr:HK97 gp10 family phage protein [Clostridium sp.]